MARLNYHQFAKQNLLPATIGGLDGFRVEFSFVSEQSLEYKYIWPVKAAQVHSCFG